MKATSPATTSSSPVTLIVLGLLAALLIFSVLTGRKLPLIGSERVALIVLLVIGVAMCAPGIGRVAAANAWASPFAILGYLLGAVILLVGFAGIFGFSLPLIDGPRSAIIAVAVLAVVKVVLSAVHRVSL